MATAKAKRRSKKSGKGFNRSESTMKSMASALGDVMERVAAAVPSMLGIDIEFDSLRDLLIKELQDLYSAEKQLVSALPKMAKAAKSAQLRDAFESHLAETRGHVERLERVFSRLKVSPQSKTCKAMKGLVEEGSEWMSEHATPGVMDAGLIAAAQRVEHYEIAGYGCVRTYAKLLGEIAVANLLQQTLDEEGAADKKLTTLSKKINVRADDGHASKKPGANGRGRASRRKAATS